jgi:hypothetical protein
MQMDEDDLLVGLARVGRPSGEALEEDRTDAVEVRARVDVRLRLRLLRGHVERCPEDGAAAGKRKWRGPVARALDLRHAEVDDLREERIEIALHEEHVVRLEVPMDDPRGVRLRQALEDLGDDVHRVGERDAPRTAEALPEVLAAKELHHEVRAAVLRAGVEHRDDVRTLDGAHRPRLAREAADHLLVGGELGIDELDRDALAEAEVLRLVHRAHAAVADEPPDHVPAGERLADQRLAGCPRAYLRRVGRDVDLAHPPRPRAYQGGGRCPRPRLGLRRELVDLR